MYSRALHRQFLAQIQSPAYERRYACETTVEVEYEKNIDPEIDFVFENNEKKTIAAKNMSMADLFQEVQNVIEDMETRNNESLPENEEENPYLAMAKQQEEKLEAKRKKMLAMEGARKGKKR